MALVKLSDFNATYQENPEDPTIQGFSVYVEGNEKIGTVEDLLVDEVTGRLRYLIVDLGFWIFGKKVLLPVGRARFDQQNDRFLAMGFTKEQAEQLPEFNHDLALDTDYEANIRQVYRQTPHDSVTANSVATESGTDSELDLRPTADASNSDRGGYSYDCDPELYAMNEQDHQLLKLYEERLIASKNRTKTGEVSVGKQVETRTAQTSIPLKTERVVISHAVPDSSNIAPLSQRDFQEGEVARIEIYEETPNIRKEVFVREEVSLTKKVEHKIVEVEDTVRRETLDVNSQGHNIVDRRS